MGNRADGARAAHPLFQAGDGGSIPTSALSFRLEPLRFAEAKVLNRLWHSTLPELGTGSIKNPEGRFTCYGAYFGGLWYAVGIWSLPAARGLPQDGTWFELRRLAIGPDAPRNTASRMLRIMALLVRRDRPKVERLVSFQDMEAHTGAIYRGAGWAEVVVTRGGQWDTPKRRRPKVQRDAPKRRWEKVIRPPVLLLCSACFRRVSFEEAENPTGKLRPAFRCNDGLVYCGECAYEIELLDYTSGDDP